MFDTCSVYLVTASDLMLDVSKHKKWVKQALLNQLYTWMINIDIFFLYTYIKQKYTIIIYSEYIKYGYCFMGEHYMF